MITLQEKILRLDRLIKQLEELIGPLNNKNAIVSDGGCYYDESGLTTVWQISPLNSALNAHCIRK